MKTRLFLACFLLTACFLVATSANDASNLVARNDGVSRAFGCSGWGSGCP